MLADWLALAIHRKRMQPVQRGPHFQVAFQMESAPIATTRCSNPKERVGSVGFSIASEE